MTCLPREVAECGQPHTRQVKDLRKLLTGKDVGDGVYVTGHPPEPAATTPRREGRYTGAAKNDFPESIGARCRKSRVEFSPKYLIKSNC